MAKHVERAGRKAEYVPDALSVDDLPLLMKKGVALEFLAWQLCVHPVTLYMHGIAVKLPVRYLTVRRLRSGGVRLSLPLVPREKLLEYLRSLLGPAEEAGPTQDAA